MTKPLPPWNRNFEASSNIQSEIESAPPAAAGIALTLSKKMSEITRRKVDQSLKRFRDYANDVQSATVDTFDDRLEMFFSFCETDSVFSKIHTQLSEMPSVDFKSWKAERDETGGSFVGSKELSFPTDQEQRLALMYQLILSFRSGDTSWTDFGMRYFRISDASYNDYIYEINSAIIEPMMRELEYRLEDIEDELPDETSANVPSTVFQIIHNATNVINQSASGSGNVQTATIHHSEALSAEFDKLKDLVKSESSDTEGDLEIVEAAAAEAGSAQPKKKIVGALLNGLSIAGSGASIIGTILTAIG